MIRSIINNLDEDKPLEKFTIVQALNHNLGTVFYWYQDAKIKYIVVDNIFKDNERYFLRFDHLGGISVINSDSYDKKDILFIKCRDQQFSATIQNF